MAAPCPNIGDRHDPPPSVLHIAADELEPGAPLPAAGDLPDDADDAALAALVGRIVYQDETALAELYRRCGSRLFRQALRLAGDAASAEEVVEDVFWQAWRQAPRFDATRGSVLAWLMQMARSRAIDARRGAARNPLHGAAEIDEATLSIPAAGEAEPAACLQAAQLARQMETALARLDPLRRQLVSLAFQRGCTQAEIAEQTGLPLGAVKSHLRRALAQMKESIDPALHVTLPERPGMSGTRERLRAIGGRLATRVHDSAVRHREFRTVRRADREWRDVAPGVSEAVLVRHGQARVVIVRLDAGAALPWNRGATRQEVLVIDGDLRAVDGAGVDTLLQRHGFALRDDAGAGRLVAEGGRAELYLRELLVEPAALPEAEARWWSIPHAPLTAVRATDRRWHITFPGVQVMPLWGVPAITSMLVRFNPGAGVPDHRHEVHEDCLMLDGEMFLGDILLQPGDYQLAPAGGGHFGEMSDVGGLFFFHGAIDPVLVPPRP